MGSGSPTRPDGPPTGIVLLNMGGPAGQSDVEPFLRALFADRELIQLPWQRWLGSFIARRRSPKVRRLYAEIGGGSPIVQWTRAQGSGLVSRLNAGGSGMGPFRFYTAFRYSPPFAVEALREMVADGVSRAVAFVQYPQFSCATSGSSLNELWRAARRMGLEDVISWSVIDRFGSHAGFVRAMARSVQEGMARFPHDVREDVVLLFSAHSLPLAVVDRGDPYPQEVAASVEAVMEALGRTRPYVLAWQSQVGPARWLGPSTGEVIRRLGARGNRNILVVPIAFVNDHIETLSEIDLGYAAVARDAGVTHFYRAPALNDDSVWLDAMADIVREHLDASMPCSRQYGFRCPGCTNPACRDIASPVLPYTRDALGSGP